MLLSVGNKKVLVMIVDDKIRETETASYITCLKQLNNCSIFDYSRQKNKPKQSSS